MTDATSSTPSPDRQPQRPTSPLSDADRPHRAADDAEEIYFEGSPQLRSLLGITTLMVVLALLVIGGAVAAAVHYRKWWALLAIPIGLILLIIPRYISRSTRYRISNYRIDYERGLLSKNIDTLELWHVEDISFHQSFPDRIVGVGNITVLSHDDTNPKLILKGLPNPRPLFDQLKQRIISVKRQRGVIKMDSGT
jgi:hypothetical protein